MVTRARRKEGRSRGERGSSGGAKIDVGGEKREFSKRGLMEAGGVGECESGKILKSDV